MPVESMAITDSEEVQTELAAHVWAEDVAVLVWLVWITWLVPNACSKGKLSDTVELLSCYLQSGLSWSYLSEVFLRLGGAFFSASRC